MTTPDPMATQLALAPFLSMDPNVVAEKRNRYIRIPQSVSHNAISRTPPTRMEKVVAKRRVGMLKTLLDVPLDIILEIFALLDPTDILILCRLSKKLRGLLMSRKSSYAWRASLERDTPYSPPRCPTDLSYPQYASLVFDKFCMACGRTNDTIRTDWAVRLRFCAPCRDENFISGSSLMTKYPLSNGPNSHDREEIYHFLYLTIPATGSLAYSENQVANGVYSYFFRPEAESALAFLEDTWRREDYSRFRTFFDRGRERSQRMRTEGRTLHSWSSDKVFLEKEQRFKVKTDRSQEMTRRLSELGWDTQYFPTSEDEDTSLFRKWNRCFNQPSKLTEKNWTTRILPKLREIYETRKMEADRTPRTESRYGCAHGSTSESEA